MLVPAGDEEARRVVAAAGLAPGAPLEAESVRHAVELLFATGRYADVRVEAAPAPDGTDADGHAWSPPRSWPACGSRAGGC